MEEYLSNSNYEAKSLLELKHHKFDSSRTDSPNVKNTCDVSVQCNIPKIFESLKCDVATQCDALFTKSQSIQCGGRECEDSVIRLSPAEAFQEVNGVNTQQHSGTLSRGVNAHVSSSQLLQSYSDATDVCECCRRVFKSTNLTYFERKEPNFSVNKNTSIQIINDKTKVCNETSVVSSSQEPSSEVILFEAISNGQQDECVTIKNRSIEHSKNVKSVSKTITSSQGTYSENYQWTEKCHVQSSCRNSDISESEEVDTNRSSKRRKTKHLQNISLAPKTKGVVLYDSTSTDSNSDKDVMTPTKCLSGRTETEELGNDFQNLESEGFSEGLNPVSSSSVTKKRHNCNNKVQNPFDVIPKSKSSHFGRMMNNCESGSPIKARLLINKKKLKPYTRQEQDDILNYIIKHNYYNRVTSKSLWEEIAVSGVLRGRTWQSIRNHFRKTLWPNLKNFNLGSNIEGKFPRFM